MPTRKYHHKSTTGCAECKSARVKCDETKPECTRCARQGRSCSYGRHNSAPSPASSSGGAQANPDEAISLPAYRQDIELMHHYAVHAYISLSQEQSIRTVWQRTAVKQALKFPFLLRAIFAFSALHLSNTLPPKPYPTHSTSSNPSSSPAPSSSSQPTTLSSPQSSVPPPTNPANPLSPSADTRTSTRLRWYERAVADYGLALNLARPELEAINEENCHAALMFSSLIAIVRLAMPQVTGDYGPDGVLGYVLETFHLLRGKAAISDAAQSWIFRGPLKGVVADREVKAPRDIPPSILGVLEQYEAMARADSEAVAVKAEDGGAEQSAAGAKERLGAYMFAIAGMRAYFACEPGGAAAVRIATAWPVRLPGPFMADLRTHEPLALAILGYYAVMLDDQREHWWIGDTGKQLLLQIAGVLGGNWGGALAPAREHMEFEIAYYAQITSLRLFSEGEGSSPFIGFVNSSDLSQRTSPGDGDNKVMSGVESGAPGPPQYGMNVPPTPSYGSSSPYREIPEEDDDELSDEPAVQQSVFGVSLPTGELPGQAHGQAYMGSTQ